MKEGTETDGIDSYDDADFFRNFYNFIIDESTSNEGQYIYDNTMTANILSTIVQKDLICYSCKADRN